MRDHSITTAKRLTRFALTAGLLGALGFGGVTIAHAAGTGDLPDPPPDTLSRTELSRRRALEALDEREIAARTASSSPSGGLSAQSLVMPELPYRFLYTPTHAQERSYWCGPATVQVIDDYFGAHASQATIAAWMGTTTNGTSFTIVDDALRYFAGKSYYYYGALTLADLWYRVEHSLMDHAQPLAIDVRIVATVWPNYVFDHAGHITPLEGFDWRYWVVRLNDVYDESYWRAGGGSTLGHLRYKRDVIGDGVMRHPQRAVVSAP